MSESIVVLDGFTLNPGDLDWGVLESLGALQVYDRTGPTEIETRALNVSCLLTNKTPLTAGILARLPQLRYIGVLATGYNVVDIPVARQAGICVTNVPGYGTTSVAQHTWALMLALTNQVAVHAAAVRQEEWNASPDFCFTRAPLTELSGRTLGIVGYGEIGQTVAALGRAMGMHILAASRSPKPGVNQVPLAKLFAESDVVSLHCPLTEENRGFVDWKLLQTMKRSALLINTSRGPLVVEEDLAEALNLGVIAGAGLDVLSVEPPAAGNPLLKARNCIITPHIAWATHAARARLLAEAMENLRAFLAGEARNVIS